MNNIYNYNDNSLGRSDPVYHDRVVNSVHTQNNWEAKQLLLETHRKNEDPEFKVHRLNTARYINPTRASFKNLLQSLNEILSWTSVTLTAEDDTKDLIKKIGLARFAYSQILPRQLDSPNMFWALFPYKQEMVNGSSEMKFIIELFNYEDVCEQENKDRENGIFYDIKINVRGRKKLSDGTYYFTQNGIRTAKFIDSDGQKGYAFDLGQNTLKYALYGQLGGDLDPLGLNGDEKYFTSPIQGAFDTATSLFLLTLDAKLVELQAMNIITGLKAIPCKSCDGSGKYSDEDRIQKPCKSCKGSGNVEKALQLNSIVYTDSTIQARGKEKQEAMSEMLNNMISYNHAPLAPLEYAREEKELLIKKLYNDLAQVVPKTFQESASSNEQQWLNRHYLCDTIGVVFFDTLEKIVQTIQDCTKVSSPDVKFTVPETFIDENETVIRHRINQMRKDGATNAELLAESERLANKIYKDEPNKLRAEIYRLQNDYLAVYNSDEKVISAGSERDRIYSEQLPSILARISDKDATPNFYELSDDEITELVNKQFTYVEPPEITDGSEFNIEIDE